MPNPRPSARSYPRLRDLAEPRKAWGQHFLTDPNILAKIADAAFVAPGQIVLEIGPGLGHLTRVLAQRGAHVVAVEIDPNLAARLQSDFRDMPSVRILEGDFLARPPRAWLQQAGIERQQYRVVANLPYYITSAILRHLLESEPPPVRIVVLVQREVAQQIAARPPKMNLLGVSVQFYGEPQILSTVPAGAFYPRPKVDSAIITIELKSPLPPVDPERFFQMVRAGFSARRKQLRNSLSGGLALAADTATRALVRAGIEPTRRAETLTLAEWLRLYSALSL